MNAALKQLIRTPEHFYQDRSIAIEMEYFRATRQMTFGAKRKFGRWWVLVASGWRDVNDNRRMV